MLEEGFGLEDWRAGKALASARAPAWASQFLVLSARWAGSRQDVGGERLASRAPRASATRLAALPPSSLSIQVKSSQVQTSQVKFASNFSSPALLMSPVRPCDSETVKIARRSETRDRQRRPATPGVWLYCT
jgi:hypothetical protein